MTSNDELNIENFPIAHVLLSENNAIITRAGKIDINPGTMDFSIANLTPNLNEASMHLAIIENDDTDVIIQNPILRLEKTERVVYSKEKELEKEIKAVNLEIREIDKKIGKISKKQENTKNLIRKTTEFFPIQYSNRNIRLDHLKTMAQFTEKNLHDLYVSYTENNKKKSILLSRRDKINEELKEIRSIEGTKKYLLNFSLVSPNECQIRLQLRYRVPSKWRPSYDLKINNATAEVLLWGIIENLSGEDWDAVNLELDYTTFGDATIARPKILDLKRGIQGVLDEKFQEFGMGKMVEKKQTTQRLKPIVDQISVPADDETHAYLMQKFLTEIELFYYWNAAETDAIIMGAKFKNGPFDLLPGDCNYFKADKIIGRGKFQKLYEANQVIRQPLAVDSSIIATKRLIDQKRPKQNKFVLRYKVHLINREQPKNVEILDIIPISNQPRSKIRLLESNPEPEQPKSGLLKWYIKLEDEWEASYSVEFVGFEKVGASSDK